MVRYSTTLPLSMCMSRAATSAIRRSRKLFAATPGLVVMDELEKKSYPMPFLCDGRDETFIGRIREDISSPNGLAFWCVSDNLRKGAATNAVQIAELLIQDYL